MTYVLTFKPDLFETSLSKIRLPIRFKESNKRANVDVESGMSHWKEQ